MARFPMAALCIGVTIGLNKNEPRRIILLLEAIESRDARFIPAFARVGYSGLFESLYEVRFDTDLNVINQHKIRS
jgi:hypothetical protein